MSAEPSRGVFVLQTSPQPKIIPMNGRKPARGHRRPVLVGWIVAIAGMALWTYGLVATGVPPGLDWPSFSPAWVADFVPNRLAEVGLVLSCVGMVPVYYAQFKERRRRH